MIVHRSYSNEIVLVSEIGKKKFTYSSGSSAVFLHQWNR